MSDRKFIGIIYKISSPSTDEIYVGSTTKSLKIRFARHHQDYERYLKGEFSYTSSFEILALGNASIQLFYEGLFDTKADLFRLEGETMQALDNVCNKSIPGRTSKDYETANKDHIRDVKSEYYRKNREQIAEKKK